MPTLTRAEALIQNAIQHHEAGQLDAAEPLYRQALALAPDQPAALHFLGILLHQARRADEAPSLIERATQLLPTRADWRINLGNVHLERGDLPAAIRAYQAALCLDDSSALAWASLASALHRGHSFAEAEDAARLASARDPHFFLARHVLGQALLARGHADDAVEQLRLATTLAPNSAEARLNLGNALKEADRLDEAASSYRLAIRLKPDLALAHSNLATVLLEQGASRRAIAHYSHAVALAPDFADAHLGLAFSLLREGELERGWQEYEWRWHYRDFLPNRRQLDQPEWQGEPLTHRTLLVHAEQGYGDSLQFARFVPEVADRAARVILEVPPALTRLLGASLAPSLNVTVLARGEALPTFDFHLPLLSLPHRLGVRTLDQLASSALPYLHAPAGQTDWRSRIAAAESPGPRIGLVWAGNPGNKRNSLRSLQLADLQPVFEALPHAAFFSLQLGESRRQLLQAPHVLDLAPDLHDFADTAAALAELDLLITVDTAVAHLAGGLGIPTLVLLSSAADWRWFADRADSPWYPSVRLYRQTARGSWAAPARALANALPRSLRPLRAAA